MIRLSVDAARRRDNLRLFLVEASSASAVLVVHRASMGFVDLSATLRMRSRWPALKFTAVQRALSQARIRDFRSGDCFAAIRAEGS